MGKIKAVIDTNEGEADYIVSGDEHLFDLKHYKSIQIVDARAFLKILGVSEKQ